MCGRYTWKATNGGKFKKLVQQTEYPEKASYNRAPGQSHPSPINQAASNGIICFGETLVQILRQTVFSPSMPAQKPYMKKRFLETHILKNDASFLRTGGLNGR